MFRQSSIHPIILLIIGLAGFGLLYRLITNPLGLIKEIVIAAVVIGIIFMIYKYLMKKRFGGGYGQAHSKYQQAVKQSKKRFNDSSSNQPTKVRGLTQKASDLKRPFRSSQSSKKKEHNLTVIDGKKGKKKNRALF